MAKFQDAKNAAEAPAASSVSAAALMRKIELEALQQELFQLKSVVVDLFIHPQIEVAEPDESVAEPVETVAVQIAAEIPASDAKPNGIKLSLTPREQTNLTSSSASLSPHSPDTDSESAKQLHADESATVMGKSPILLSS